MPTILQCPAEKEPTQALEVAEVRKNNASVYSEKGCSQSKSRLHIDFDDGAVNLEIDNGSITLNKLANIPANTVLGSVAGGQPQALTSVQARNVLDVYSRAEVDTRDSNTLSSASALVSSLTTTNVAEGTNLYFTGGRVRATPLTGLSTVSNTPITATDTVLSALSSLQRQLVVNPANQAQVLTEIVRNRFISNGLSFLPHQSIALRRFYDNLLIELQGTPLPVILFVPGLSFDNTLPNSTIPINLGTATITSTLANSTVSAFTNGYSYQFDGTNDRIETNFVMPNNISFFAKFNVLNVVGNKFLMAGSAVGQPGIRISGATPQIMRADVAVVASGAVITANTNHIISFNKNSTDVWNAWQSNGITTTKFLSNASNAGAVNSDFRLGASLVSAPFGGSLFASMLFDYVLSDVKTERLINLIWT